jgi:uncharacterized protein with FMN-binding domain
VTSGPVQHTRRNTITLACTALVVGLLFWFPTSTNRSSTPRRPGQALATPGVVTSTTGTSRDVVVNGSSVDTRYGPVQVQLRIRGERILSATAIDYPVGDRRDREINSVAVPVLQQETVQAQSANIDTVSGATYTSDGYRRSLQAALDLAHLA